MRFLVKEHRSFLKAIQEGGLDKASFSFVKRRGRLHMFYEQTKKPFLFYRKTETRLDEAGRWSKHVCYYLGKGHDQPCEKWEEVVEAFKKWLIGLLTR